MIVIEELNEKIEEGNLFIATYHAIDKDHTMAYLLNDHEELMVSIDDWKLIDKDGEFSEKESKKINNYIKIGMTEIILARTW